MWIYRATCIIGDDTGGQWEERLKVESEKTAKTDLEKIVSEFNASLRKHERPRKLIKLIGVERVVISDPSRR